MANAAWMIMAWSLMALDPRIHPDFVIMGTDPILSPVVVFAWRLLRPRVRFAHWCFDLYPEAAIEAGLVRDGTYAVRAIQRLLGAAYRRQALIVDIGSCMRRRLEAYTAGARAETIPPWALVEPQEPVPIDPTERQLLFGGAQLGLLYSGAFGRAHSWVGIPELARALAVRSGRIAFSVGGNAAEALRKYMQESGVPVTFAPMVPGDRLAARLSAGDVQIVSLRENWTGTVVPSKFFGALAIGRPVLFLGSPESAIAKWINELQVGWVLNLERIEQLAMELTEWSQCSEAKLQMFRRCHAAYQQEFSRTRGLDCWNRALRSLK
jgi:glycosyltransferase involved in cell wall biosynthesis